MLYIVSEAAAPCAVLGRHPPLVSVQLQQSCCSAADSSDDSSSSSSSFPCWQQSRQRPLASKMACEGQAVQLASPGP